MMDLYLFIYLFIYCHWKQFGLIISDILATVSLLTILHLNK